MTIHAPVESASAQKEAPAGETEEEEQTALEELRVAEEELRVQNEELATTYQALQEAHEILAAERRWYQDLFDFAPAAYLTTDGNCLIQEANRAAAALLNVAQPVLIGRHLDRYLASEERGAFWERLHQVLHGDIGNTPSNWLALMRPPARPPFYAAFTVTAIRDRSGQPQALRWLMQDITAERRMREALRQSEERYRLLAEALPQLVWLEAPDGSLEYGNRHLHEYVGWGEGRPTNATWVTAVHDADIRAALDQWRQAPAKGEPYELECRFRRAADGTYRWHLVRVFPIRREDGQIEHWLGTAIDITERKQAEETLRRAKDDLETLVSARTAELAKLNQTLQAEVAERRQAEVARAALLRQLVTAQEEERQRISRELHDEMGQHLTALMLGLKSLEDRQDPAVGSRLEQLQRLCDQIGQEVHRLALELRPTSLDDLGLHTTLLNYAEEWSERYGIDVDFQSTDLESERLPSEVATALYRVVQESLTNVLKHAQARQVSLILNRDSNSVQAIVEDNGCGFDMEATLNSAQSSGRLGLLGMQERVAQVGGTLTIESAPNGGTTVFARIPLPES